MRTRSDYYHAKTGIHTRRLVPTSRLVAGITGMLVQRNKAIVGRNAFAHEAGIHQDGMLKERTTYEIMLPEDVGFTQTDLVLGKHSGRAALADRAATLGHELTGEQLDRVFEDFKKLADKKKEIYDGDSRRAGRGQAGRIDRRRVAARLLRGPRLRREAAHRHDHARARRREALHHRRDRRRAAGRPLQGRRRPGRQERSRA